MSSSRIISETDPINHNNLELIKKIKEKIIGMLADKTFKNGEKFYSDENKNCLQELLNMIYKAACEKDDLKEEINDIQKILEKDYDSEYHFIFSLPQMKKNVENYKIISTQRKIKIDVGEGIYTCSKCGSKTTISAQKKARSIDEPMVTVVKCNDCGKQWIMG